MNALLSISSNLCTERSSTTKKATTRSSVDQDTAAVAGRAMNYGEGVINPKRSTSRITDISNRSKGIAARAIIPDINQKNGQGFTPLHLAILNKTQLEIEKLISLGADIHIASKDGSTPLHYAAYKGNLSLLKNLITLGVDIQAKNLLGCTAIYCAVRGGHTQTISALLALGLDIESKDQNGKTPLHYAINSGNLKIVEFLLTLGANPNAKSADGLIPLHQAVCRGDIKMVERLFAKGADIKAQNKYGCSPLHVAIDNHHPHITSKLLALGADIKTKTETGMTPYVLAKLWNDEEILALLKEDPYSSAYLCIKKLAHVHNLEGHIILEGNSIDFEYFEPQFFYNEWEKILNKTDPQNYREEELKILKQAFAQAANLRTPSTEILSQITEGRLTIIPVSSLSHITTAIFYKNLLFYCDRGAYDHYPISCFEIFPIKITKEIIDKIRKPFSNEGETWTYFTSTLPVLLSPLPTGKIDHRSSEVCRYLEMSLPLSIQKVSNCSYASTKGALSVALTCVCQDPLRGLALYRKLSREIKKSAWEEAIKNPLLIINPQVQRILTIIQSKSTDHFNEVMTCKGIDYATMIEQHVQRSPTIFLAMYSLFVTQNPFIAGLWQEIHQMEPLEHDLFIALIEGFHLHKIPKKISWIATKNLDLKFISLSLKMILRARKARPIEEDYDICFREVTPLLKGHPDAYSSKEALADELEAKINTAIENLLTSRQRP